MTRTTTWNALGTDVSTTNDVESALNKAGLNFIVEKAPLSKYWWTKYYCS